MPTDAPSDMPTDVPTDTPSDTPTDVPSDVPTDAPSDMPTVVPTDAPSNMPTDAPSDAPSDTPTDVPSDVPTDAPSDTPTNSPSDTPSDAPSDTPTDIPSSSPSDAPSHSPSAIPSDTPSDTPTSTPTANPTTDAPTSSPSDVPSGSPTSTPSTQAPSDSPTDAPSDLPSDVPSNVPTDAPTTAPTATPTSQPTIICDPAVDDTCACPSQCDAPGGTCSLTAAGDFRCLSCRSDRFLVESVGRCPKAIYCRARTIIQGPYVNESCRCSEDTCFYCRQSASEEYCLRCRQHQYLDSSTTRGRCVETCPSHLAGYGIGAFGRECVTPFECVLNLDESGNVCKCDDKQFCATCSYGAGLTGAICQRCKNNRFLLDGVCVATCPATHEPLTDTANGDVCSPIDLISRSTVAP
eukprot:m.521716 g.521716  ORF g.521716 m.521716 type:complete len:408 (-) comp21962_c0_seq6:162-1385(-)